ncbi:MAG TPA: ATP synthase F1 subunit gamma, partial [Vampirovibrionales bacterium]
MPSTKDIRTRIKSVNSIQKVTKSMKLISIIKLKHAQKAFQSSIPYVSELADLLSKAAKGIEHEELLNKPKLKAFLTDRKENLNPCIIILSSDRGLCGPYNTQILKLAEAKVKDYLSKGIQPKLILSGNKAILFAKKYLSNCEVICKFNNLSNLPQFNDADNIFQVIEKGLMKDEISSVEVVYSRFVSMLKSVPESITLAPFNLESFSCIEDEEITQERYEDISFEPNQVDLLESLVPMYCKNQIFQCLNSGKTSELANRVNAMTSATDNAKNLISDLTLTYNKFRQAS